jgi:hypothetical protein
MSAFTNKIIEGKIDNLYENMIMMCEIRGQLDPESNAKTEKEIEQMLKEIDFLQQKLL